LDFDLRPTRLEFGEGAWEYLPGILQGLGTRVLLLTSSGRCGQASRLERLADDLDALGIELEVLSTVRPNPDFDDLLQCREMRGIDLVLGVGGGSVLDAAKVVALGLAQEDDQWVSGDTRMRGDGPKLPSVLVPTTAGTGSEVSFGAILSARRRGWKGGLRGESLAPSVALVDPILTLSMPERLTAITGFDVLTHAIESFVSRRATSHSRALSVSAMRVVGRVLPEILDSPNDLGARSQLAYASTMMGLNLRLVGTALPHRMQYSIGGRYQDLAHGECLAWLYPAWFELVVRHVPDDADAIVRNLLGATAPSPARARALIEGWLHRIGLRTSPPAGVHVSPESVVENMEGSLENDPIPEPRTAAAHIISEVFL
jgi:alcohol dehydrogenase class IV